MYFLSSMIVLNNIFFFLTLLQEYIFIHMHIYITCKICINRLFMLLARLPDTHRLLVVNLASKSIDFQLWIESTIFDLPLVESADAKSTDTKG